VWEPNCGGSRISKWGDKRVRAPKLPTVLGVGRGVPLRIEEQKKFDLVSQIGEFWCKFCAFCTVHLKLVLRSWERRSHCQNNWERRSQAFPLETIPAYSQSWHRYNVGFKHSILKTLSILSTNRVHHLKTFHNGVDFYLQNALKLTYEHL